MDIEMKKTKTRMAKNMALALGLIAGTTSSLAAATFNFDLAFVTESFSSVSDPFGVTQPARASGTISFNDRPNDISTFGPTITRYSGVGT